MRYTVQTKTEKRPEWTGDAFGDTPEYDDALAARDAINSLVELGDEWGEAEYRIVDENGAVVFRCDPSGYKWY